MSNTKSVTIDPSTLGTDANYPEVFALYLTERGFDVEIDAPTHGDTNAEWEEYCSLPRAEYVRLAKVALAHDEGRRAAYIDGLEAEPDFAGASICVELHRGTIDPAGEGSDEDREACAAYVLDAVRTSFHGADVRRVGSGGRQGGAGPNGENLDAEVDCVVNHAFDAWCAL